MAISKEASDFDTRSQGRLQHKEQRNKTRALRGNGRIRSERGEERESNGFEDLSI